MPDRPAVPTAVVHRLAGAGHLCPWGLQALHLLRRRGYRVEDRPLAGRAEADAFKAAHGVRTTPQVFIDGVRIGGYEDLRRHLGLRVRDPAAPTYAPVLTLFATAVLMALAASQAALGTPWTLQAAEWAGAFAMCLLAFLKVQDLGRFAAVFLGYDLLARRWVPYARLYPFLEGGAGLLMAAGVLHGLAAAVALAIGAIGGASVVQAVWIERRDLRCACVGGGTNVPLGALSLAENAMMIAMGIWMGTGLLR